MPNLCFSTYVYGFYQDFIAPYIFSILHSFPQHHVKIFVEDELTPSTKACIDAVATEVSDSFEVIDNFHELDWCEVPHKAGNRFLLTRDYFDGFDYVYFGDVDFIIYNEHNDQFFDHYVAHCQSTGLPFSNEWNFDFGKYRMTGLHFILKEPYFDAMTDRILETRQPLKSYFRRQCPFYEGYPSYDEEMLFYMCLQEFDLRVLAGYRRPFHGLHLGTFRPFDKSWSFSIDHHGMDYIKDWRAASNHIDEIMKSELFKFIYDRMSWDAKAIVDNANFVLSTNMFA